MGELIPLRQAPDWWDTLQAAATRPDVPPDVQAAALAALAYRDSIGDQIEVIAGQVAASVRKAARLDWCGW